MPREYVPGKLTAESPAAGAGETIQAIDWAGVTTNLQDTPGEWMRLHHHYTTERSVRTSVAKAAQRHGFKFQVTRSKPERNGLPGVFLMWPAEKEG